MLQTKIVKKTKNRVKILKYFVRNPIIGKVLRISEPNVTVNVVTYFIRSFECVRYFAFRR